MDQLISSLGTKQLHKRHSVMIEGGKIPRAKVMDQTIMDRFLMNGTFSIAQHQASETLLQQAIWAGMWPKGVRWDGSGGGSPGCVVPFGVTPFGNSLRAIRAAFSADHATLVRKMIVNDCDISNTASNTAKVQEALDFISDGVGGRMADPIRRLRKRAA